MKTTLTIPEAQAAFDLYLEILESVNQTALSGPDISHSALLKRCLRGEPVFPFQPPQAYSYPCYHIAEGKPVIVTNLYKGEDGFVAVNQYRYKRLADDLILDERSGLRFRLLVDGLENDMIIGVIIRADMPDKKEQEKWRKAY